MFFCCLIWFALYMINILRKEYNFMGMFCVSDMHLTLSSGFSSPKWDNLFVGNLLIQWKSILYFKLPVMKTTPIERCSGTHIRAAGGKQHSCSLVKCQEKWSGFENSYKAFNQFNKKQKRGLFITVTCYINLRVLQTLKLYNSVTALKFGFVSTWALRLRPPMHKSVGWRNRDSGQEEGWKCGGGSLEGCNLPSCASAQHHWRTAYVYWDNWATTTQTLQKNFLFYVVST